MSETLKTTAEVVEYAENNGLTAVDENLYHIRFKNLDDDGEPQRLPKTVRNTFDGVELRYILQVEK